MICVACEGSPKFPNDPCAVCGTEAAEIAALKRQLAEALHVASVWQLDAKLLTDERDALRSRVETWKYLDEPTRQWWRDKWLASWRAALNAPNDAR